MSCLRYRLAGGVNLPVRKGGEVHYLGRREVTPEIVEKVARQLSFEELTRLLGGRLQMSAWLDDLLAPTAHQELIHSA
ncbi:hypothetical protein [Acidithrix sp. C25]|uniref:hypothetical protein n=1 Tax=Acidithrix sp. C25 TaxID=1671482 RepID=UPI00191B94EC|nr:hypothetical protein [Acidithrix sp. C25]